jgi:uncharacterized membrane protein YidH (DUF202 family)
MAGYLADYHRITSRPDFNYTHEWMGVIAYCLSFLNFAVGFKVFGPFANSQETRERLLKYHVMTGLLALCTTFATMVMGITEQLVSSESCRVARDYEYSDLSKECRLANGLMVTLVATFMVTMFALLYPANKALHEVNPINEDSYFTKLR